MKVDALPVLGTGKIALREVKRFAVERLAAPVRTEEPPARAGREGTIWPERSAGAASVPPTVQKRMVCPR